MQQLSSKLPGNIFSVNFYSLYYQETFFMISRLKAALLSYIYIRSLRNWIPNWISHKILPYSANYSMLSGFEVSTCMESEREVIRCLRLALTDAVKDIIQQITSVMSSRRNFKTNLNKHSVPERLCDSIPKEWNCIPKETKRKESSKGILVFL